MASVFAFSEVSPPQLSRAGLLSLLIIGHMVPCTGKQQDETASTSYFVLAVFVLAVIKVMQALQLGCTDNSTICTVLCILLKYAGITLCAPSQVVFIVCQQILT